MRTLLLCALVLGMMGCQSAKEQQAQREELEAIHTNELKTQWYSEYTDTTNDFSERASSCMIEMYSQTYSPVGSGPICRESCQLREKVNAMVKAAPPYIDNPSQYAIGGGKESAFCRNAEKSKKGTK